MQPDVACQWQVYDYGECESLGDFQMSTAIARFYVPDGFVVAADGRECKPDGTILRDDTQKVFPIIMAEHIILAYSIAGSPRIVDNRSGAILLDFGSSVAELVREIRPPMKLVQFGEVLKDRLLTRLEVAKATRFPTTQGHESRSKTYIFLDGYYRRLPKRLTIRFLHTGIAESETDADVQIGDLNENCGYGSKAVLDRLNREDAALAKYLPANLPSRATLQDAIRVARNRVMAHCSEEALVIDQQCKFMGGRIRVAKVTLNGGFEWDERA